MTTVNHSSFKPIYDVAIVGGLGHVGLPLGLAFADAGLKVLLCDPNKKSAAMVERGQMPFIEYGAEEILKRVIRKNLFISSENAAISQARFVVLAIGTPVDEYLNPKLKVFLDFAESIKTFLHPEQVIIVRSTVFPRTCEHLVHLFGSAERPAHIAYCPERIAQGYAIKELAELPQVVSGFTDHAVDRAVELFEKIAPKVIRSTVSEAELVKLFSNAWRYIQFAASNQFFMIAKNFGVDFTRVREIMREGYGRASTLPAAGFAAGPCLLKDTMQLAAFNSNNFHLGYAAMTINEGLPNFLVEDLKKRIDLHGLHVGILGMAFKSEVDDIRDSLSFKLAKVLRFHGAHVLCSDEFAQSVDFVSKEEIISSCNVVIVAVPHKAYGDLSIPETTEIVDVWGLFGRSASPRNLTHAKLYTPRHKNNLHV